MTLFAASAKPQNAFVDNLVDEVIEQAIKEAPSPGGFAGFREKFKFPALNLKCFGTRTDSCVKR